MLYIFKGSLAGLLCKECPEFLAFVTVRLYRLRKDQVASRLATANPKETFTTLSEDMIKRKSAELIAETQTDQYGHFSFSLGDKQDYDGEAFEIDVYLETVPGRSAQTAKYPPVQFSITTLQPQWREIHNQRVAAWEYVIPWRFWCGIRAHFGAYAICGMVRACKTGIPVQGVRVLAFDADWLQDDPLGSALTDATGHFRIDYTMEDFKLTPLSPWINWEMVSGPDIYFRVETPGGTQLLSEPRSRGRDADRENVGHCFCVELCLEDVVPGPGGHTHPLFNKVGQYRITTDFTAEGLTQVGNYAFTDNLPLIGILPDGADPIAMEYRFLVAKYDGGGVAGPFTALDASKIAPTIIGQLEFWNLGPGGWHIDSVDYWLNNSSKPHNVTVEPGGWIKVPAINDLGLPPAPGIGKFIPNERLATLISTELVNESFDLNLPPEQLTGNPIPAGRKPAQTHSFKIRFEARQQGSAIISDSNELNKIIISNTSFSYTRHPNWAGGNVTGRAVVMVDIREMAAPGGGCSTLTNDLHALFTVYHPFAASAQLYFEGNPPLPAPHNPVIVNGEAVSGSAGFHFDISALDPCAYILWLQLSLNLTSGYGLISGATIWDHIAFCKS